MKKLYLCLIISSAQAIVAEELPDIIRVTDTGQKVVIPPITYAVNKSLFSLLKQEIGERKLHDYKNGDGFPSFDVFRFLDSLYCTIYPTRNGYSTFIIKLEVDSTKEEHHPLRKEFLDAIHYASNGPQSDIVKEDQQTKISIRSWSHGVRFIEIETYLSQQQITVLLKELSIARAKNGNADNQ